MAGLPWFELDTDAPDHGKTVQLELLLGSDAAFTYMARLWAYCYRTHLSDRFEGPHAAAAIERVVRWPGKRGVFVQAALDCRVCPDGAGYLEQDGDALVVRGVSERLAPHLAKREADRIRLKEKRDAAAASLRARGESDQESRRRRRDVAGNTDKDRDKDRDRTAEEARDLELEGFRGKLAAAIGVPVIALGKHSDRTIASFRRWLDLGLEEHLLDECVRLAREKGVTPSSLAWWPGWIDTVTDQQLRRAAARGATGGA